MKQARITSFCLPRARGRTCILAFNTGLIASERRCELLSLRHGFEAEQAGFADIATKLNKELTSNLWESILPSIKIYSNVSKQDTYGGATTKVLPQRTSYIIR